MHHWVWIVIYSINILCFNKFDRYPAFKLTLIACTIFKRKFHQFALLRCDEWSKCILLFTSFARERPSLWAVLYLAWLHSSEQCTQRRGRGVMKVSVLYLVIQSRGQPAGQCFRRLFFFLSPEFRSECCMLQSPPTVCSTAVRGRR